MVGEFTTATLTIVITALSWLVIDIYLYVNKSETISDRMFLWSRHMMAIVFIIGFLCGHWFF